MKAIDKRDGGGAHNWGKADDPEAGYVVKAGFNTVCTGGWH